MNPNNAIKSRILTRSRTLALLKTMETDALEGLAVYSPPATLHTAPNLPEKFILPDELEQKLLKSASGFALFRRNSGEGAACTAILPPVPIREPLIYDRIEPYPLISLLQKEYKVALVLVRLGSYAVGVSAGEKLLTSKTGGGRVHGRHRKGGSSSGRFARHRDKQIEQFLARLCLRSREYIEPHLREVDYIIYGGAWTTIDLLKKQCDFLAKINKPELSPLLDIAEPDKRVLSGAVTSMFSSQIYQWGEENNPLHT